MCGCNESTSVCGCHNFAAEALIKIASYESRSEKECTAQAQKTDTSITVNFLLIHDNNGSGTIRTVSGGDGNATAEALLIYRDEIVAVGSLEDVTSKADVIKGQDPSLTEPLVYALNNGECVIPGMIEPHLHLTITPVMSDWFNYSPFGDYPLTSPIQSPVMESQSLRPRYCLDELLTAIRKDINKITDEGWWLLGNGVDTSLFDDFPDSSGNKTLLNCIDNELLDTISNERAIFLMSASGHTAYANTRALTLSWNNPLNIALHEKYGTLDNYIATTQGIIQENAGIFPLILSVHGDQLTKITNNIPKNLVSMLQLAQKRGVTMVYDAGMTDIFEPVIQNALYGEYAPFPGWQAPRIGMAKLISKLSDIPDNMSFTLPRKPEITDPFNPGTLNFYYGSLKIISDGSNQGLTGYQTEPYLCPPENNYGQFNFTDKTKGVTTEVPYNFTALVSEGCKKGWPLMIHANGEQAIEYTLQAYAQAIKKYPSSTLLRHRIEHCSLLTNDKIDLLKNLNINPSFLIGHVGYWGWTFVNYIFGEKARDLLDRCNSVASRHILLTLHSDCSVSPLGPLRLMEQAITRRMEGYPESAGGGNEHSILNAEERISSAQALAAVTYNAAWQCHAEHLVGSIEVNKLADLVILAKDPVTLTADSAYRAMRNISVRDVLIGGKSTFLTSLR